MKRKDKTRSNKHKSGVDLKRQQALLEEERRRYSDIKDTFHGMRNRTLAILTIEFAILTYFFSDIQNVLPKELYGIIFFAIAVACLLVSIGFLFYCYRSIEWPDPIGPVEIHKIQNAEDEPSFLKVMVDDYALSSRQANKILEKRGKLLNLSLYFFAIGVTILLIIKFFQ